MSDKNQPSLKNLLAAIGLIKDSDPNLVKALADDVTIDATLAKGEIDRHKSAPMEADYVKDQWSPGGKHATPTREQITMGPGEEASGAGAEKMVGHYSNPAPQHHGIEQAVERLAAMFGGFGKSMDAQNALLKSIVDSNAAVKALLIQSVISKAEEDEEDEEDESEVVEINASRAKAKDLISQIKVAKSAKKKAALTKALNEVLAEIDEAAKSATAGIRAAASKADINVVQEEEEEDEEEAEKAKKAKEAADAAAKAVTDDQGNQADREDSKNGNQDAAAKAKQLEDALKGIAMLETTVKGLMDVVSGKSKVSDQIPDIAKAKPDAIEAIIESVNQQQRAGALSDPDAMAAREIAAMTRRAASGQMDAAIVKSRLEKSSPLVRSIFAENIKSAA